MSCRTFHAIGLGFSSLDLVGLTPALPQLDDGVQLQDITRQGGGPVAQAMVTLARLGASVGFIGRMADDEPGRTMREQFDQEGVDITHLQVDPGARSAECLILVHQPTGKRSICCFRGTTGDIATDDIDISYLTSGQVLHLDGIDINAALWAARVAKPLGVTVCLDAGGPNPGLLEVVPWVNVLIAAEAFATSCSSDGSIESGARALQALGPQVVVVTCGDRGSYSLIGEDSFFTAPHAVEVVDTTGAGDVFHGAYIYGMLQGWNHHQIADFAGVTAALKCRQLGGRAGIPRLDAVLEFLAERGRDVGSYS